MIEKFLKGTGGINTHATRKMTELEANSIREKAQVFTASINTAIYCIHHNVGCRKCKTCGAEMSIETFGIGWRLSQNFCSLTCKYAYKPELSTDETIFTDYNSLLDVNGNPAREKIYRLMNPASIMHLKKVANIDSDHINTNLFVVMGRGSAKKCLTCSKTLDIANFQTGYRENQSFCSYECKNQNNTYIENLSVKGKERDRYKTTYYESHLVPWWKDRTEQLLEEYGVETLSNLNDHRDNTYIQFRCVTCETKFFSNFNDGRIPMCKLCTKGSKPQFEIYTFIQSLGFDNILYSDRSILGGKEIDIYLPDLKIGFEHDGLYFHRNNDNSEKYDLANRLGIQLVKIYSNEWKENRELIKSKIRNILKKNTKKIYARQCQVKEITSQEFKDFCDRTHIQGGIHAKHIYGLFHENVLVCGMSFSVPRFNNRYDFELIRYSSELNTTVIGGASKLLKNFRKLNTGSIISYCEKRYGTGNLYDNIGFKFIESTKPSYFYYKRGREIVSRFKAQKHLLKDLIQNFDSTKTEFENMTNAGYIKIFDLGHKVYLMHK
jgi:hypothetical protein